MDPMPYCTYSVLFDLLKTFFDFILTRPLAMELMRQITEGFLFIQQSATVIDILEFDIRLVVVLLFEITRWATVVAITAIEFVFFTGKLNEILNVRILIKALNLFKLKKLSMCH